MHNSGVSDLTDQKYATLYIVRHGETEWNLHGKLQGHQDSPLTKNGIAQAKALARVLPIKSFAAAFSSDLLRAHKTAQLLTRGHALTIKTAYFLRERNFGKHEGKTYQEARELYLIHDSLPHAQRFTHKLDVDVESDQEIVTRSLPFLNEVSAAYSGKQVLIVSHGGLMRALLVHLGYDNKDPTGKLQIKNTAYIVLRADGVDFFIVKTHGIEKVE
jgi:broad specificity phosphatase PhoE